MDYLTAIVVASIDQDKVTFPTVPLEEIFTRVAIFFFRLFGYGSSELLNTIVHSIKFLGTFLAFLFVAGIFALLYMMRRFIEEDDAKYKAPKAEVAPALISSEQSSTGTAAAYNEEVQANAAETGGGTASTVSTAASTDTTTTGVANTGAGTATATAAATEVPQSAGAQGSAWNAKNAPFGSSAYDYTVPTSAADAPPGLPGSLMGVGSIGGYASEDNRRKWQRIVNHVESVNPTDWRLAILEADILLGEMLIAMGAAGQTLGERLKSVGRGALPALDKAWDAHKVRNAIAHEGADVIITHHEARRVIKLYEEVLKSGLYIQ